jgi:hypothetical protein
VRKIPASLVNTSGTVTALHVMWKKRIFLGEQIFILFQKKNNFHEERVVQV